MDWVTCTPSRPFKAIAVQQAFIYLRFVFIVTSSLYSSRSRFVVRLDEYSTFLSHFERNITYPIASSGLDESYRAHL
ncbi:hypothetical protein BDV28DRAFT_126341, partial [Aspergillus coremiiformis]